MPVDYKNSKIYKLWSLSTDEIYIGSTVQSLAKRIGGHRTAYKRYLEGKGKYITSFKILDYGDSKIELIEHFECSCREELSAREGHFIRTLKCVNKCIPGRTARQYSQDHGERLNIISKQYYRDNREKVMARTKQYQQDNKDKIKQYRQDNKDKIRTRERQYQQDNKDKIRAKAKQYRQDNKERIRVRDKQYKQDNKERIRTRDRQKITCECGSIITKGCLSRHKKTKKHLSMCDRTRVR